MSDCSAATAPVDGVLRRVTACDTLQHDETRITAMGLPTCSVRAPPEHHQLLRRIAYPILRKIAINLMGRSRTPRVSMRARRKQAAWNDEYMLALLAG